MKTLIAIPCMESVAVGFCQSLLAMERLGDCSVLFISGSLVYDSRNTLAGTAIEMGADRILWFDSDIIIPKDAMTQLCKTMDDTNADIVTGLYFRRKAPFTPVLFKELEFDGHIGKWSNWNNYPKDSVFEIAGCGFGCVLTKTDFLKDMAERYGTLFCPMGNMGEDLSFCIRAREMEKKIICDSRVKCGHVGQVVINEDFYLGAIGGKNES